MDSKQQKRLDKLSRFALGIKNVVGTVESKTIIRLFNETGGSVELAINRLLDTNTHQNDNINANSKRPNISKENTPDIPLKKLKIDKAQNKNVFRVNVTPFIPQTHPTHKNTNKILSDTTNIDLTDTRESNLYIGKIHCNAWVTRHCSHLLKYGRELMLSTMPRAQKNLSKKTLDSLETSFVRVLIDDNTKTPPREVARLPEEIGAFVAPLLSMDLLVVKGKCLFVDKLNIGDSFLIEISCYLTSYAFMELGNQTRIRAIGGGNLRRLMDKGSKSTFANHSKESENSSNFISHLEQLEHDRKSTNKTLRESNIENLMRSRQVSLVRLFEKLYLKSTSDELTDTADLIRVYAGMEKLENNEDGDENPQLNDNQLNEIYKNTQVNETMLSLPKIEPPDDFNLKLRHYQKQGLAWMLQQEKELNFNMSKNGELSSQVNCPSQEYVNNDTKNKLLHPLWIEYKLPQEKRRDKGQTIIDLNDGDLYFYANLYSGELSRKKPTIETQTKCGILADEMGLGKTISTYSLINSVYEDKDVALQITHQGKSFRDLGNYAHRTTLIVVPMSLLSQWETEFSKSIGNKKLHLMVYYGSGVYGDLKPILCKSDAPIVMLTTYGTVLSEWTKSENNKVASGIFSVEFFRLVLDEGHTIRNRVSKTAKSCFDLKSQRRWILTGTPIINRIDDLFSLIKFLKLEPWSNYSYWKTFVSLPFERKEVEKTLNVVKSIVTPVILRRTKNMKQANGTPLVNLPPKRVLIEKVQFNEHERALYNWFFTRAKNEITDSLNRGVVLKSYTAIFALILRLRQICCHLELVKHTTSDESSSFNISEEDMKLNPEIHKLLNSVDDELSSQESASLKQRIYSQVESLENSECAICTLTPIESPGITACGHIFCINCLLEHIDFQIEHQNTPLCTLCRTTVSKQRILYAKRRCLIDNNSTHKDRLYTLVPYRNMFNSSKIGRLLYHLRILQETEPKKQVVVFSQFTSFLDIIEKELLYAGNLTVYRFDGRMSRSERQKVLERFSEKKQDDSKLVVLLISLKAGGVGINLTSSSYAFMMDPWWSPSIEDQAMDRLHRMGQTESVTIVRFIVENSIEEKMLRIQDRKRKIGEAVGANEEERKQIRIEEIKMLLE